MVTTFNLFNNKSKLNKKNNPVLVTKVDKLDEKQSPKSNVLLVTVVHQHSKLSVGDKAQITSYCHQYLFNFSHHKKT